jgi:hypothetical protein
MADLAPVSTPATKSSLDTMLDTIEAGTEVIQRVMPEAEMLGGIVPGATVYIQLAAMLLPVAQNAIKWVEMMEGKSPLEAFESILRTLAPGNGFVAPSLTLAKNPDGSFGPAAP